MPSRADQEIIDQHSSTAPRSPRTPRAPRTPRSPTIPRTPRSPRTPRTPRNPRAPGLPAEPASDDVQSSNSTSNNTSHGASASDDVEGFTRTVYEESSESRWSNIEEYIRTRSGPRPTVTCFGCTKELVIEELQEEPEGREPLHILPCGHVVGAECMARWSRIRNTCPYCRAADGGNGVTLVEARRLFARLWNRSHTTGTRQRNFITYVESLGEAARALWDEVNASKALQGLNEYEALAGAADLCGYPESEEEDLEILATLFRNKSSGTLAEEVRRDRAASRNTTAPAPDSSREGTTPVPGSSREGTMPVPGSSREGTMPVPGSNREGTMPVPGSNREGTMPVPGSNIEGTMPVPGSSREGTMSVPGSSREGTMSVSGSSREGTMSVPDFRDTPDTRPTVSPGTTPGVTPPAESGRIVAEPGSPATIVHNPAGIRTTVERSPARSDVSMVDAPALTGNTSDSGRSSSGESPRNYGLRGRASVVTPGAPPANNSQGGSAGGPSTATPGATPGNTAQGSIEADQARQIMEQILAILPRGLDTQQLLAQLAVGADNNNAQGGRATGLSTATPGATDGPSAGIPGATPGNQTQGGRADGPSTATAGATGGPSTGTPGATGGPSTAPGATPGDQVQTVRERWVEFDDPDRRDSLGNFQKVRAKVLGRLSWRGKMVIELPSLNLPDFLRYFTVRSADFGIQWKTLPLLEKGDIKGLYCQGRAGGTPRPELRGWSRTPIYDREPQGPGNNHFFIGPLPFRVNTQWHSKSSVEAEWGNYKDEMEDYLVNSGGSRVRVRPPQERSALQQLGAEYLQGAALTGGPRG